MCIPLKIMNKTVFSKQCLILGLDGKTSYDQAIIDAFVDTITPARETAFKLFFAKEEDKKVPYSHVS